MFFNRFSSLKHSRIVIKSSSVLRKIRNTSMFVLLSNCHEQYYWFCYKSSCDACLRCYSFFPFTISSFYLLIRLKRVNFAFVNLKKQENCLEISESKDKLWKDRYVCSLDRWNKSMLSRTYSNFIRHRFLGVGNKASKPDNPEAHLEPCQGSKYALAICKIFLELPL